MPVRDLEWFGGPARGAHANRGANGIDGVVSTALGVALRRPTRSSRSSATSRFVHDGGALTALAGRGVDLRIVVVDNDGGGIFSFLPQADELAGERFEQLFGTPHGTDIVALAAAHGLDAGDRDDVDALRDALDVARPERDAACRPIGPRNVAVHAALNAAVGRRARLSAPDEQRR